MFYIRCARCRREVGVDSDALLRWNTRLEYEPGKRLDSSVVVPNILVIIRDSWASKVFSIKCVCGNESCLEDYRKEASRVIARLVLFLQEIVFTLQAIDWRAPGDFPWEDIFQPWLADLCYQIAAVIEMCVSRCLPLP